MSTSAATILQLGASLWDQGPKSVTSTAPRGAYQVRTRSSIREALSDYNGAICTSKGKGDCGSCFKVHMRSTGGTDLYFEGGIQSSAMCKVLNFGTIV